MSQCPRTNTSVIAHKLQRSVLIGGRDFDGFHLSISVKYWSAVSVRRVWCERGRWLCCSLLMAVQGLCLRFRGGFSLMIAL